MKLYIGHWIEEDTGFCCFDASADLKQESVMRTEFIIAVEDLSLLCKSYAKFYPCFSQSGYECWLQRSFIRLEVLQGRSQRPFESQRAVQQPVPYERRLLEPFRQLHSQASVHIEGAISAEYKSELIFEMMKAPQNAEDLLHSMTIAQNQAEEHFDHGNLALAYTTYQKIIEDVELGFEWPPKSGRAYQCHRFSEPLCDKDVCFAEVNVRNRLSEICLALERPSQALELINRALLMLDDHDDHDNAISTRILRAKLRYQFAWANHEMDVRCRALESIDLALQLDPYNDLYKRTHQN